jgi:tetratricopeptide (TPR) repeat protein
MSTTAPEQDDAELPSKRRQGQADKLRLGFWLFIVSVLAVVVAVAYNAMQHPDPIHEGSPPPVAGLPSAVADAESPFSEQVASLVASKNPGYTGPQACAECHKEKYESAAGTNHFRACRLVTAEEMPDGFDGEKSVFQTAYPGLRFEMRREADRFFMHTVEGADSTASDLKSSIDLVLGSGGKFDDVLLSWRDNGSMVELPMAWLYPSQEWAASHFDPNSGGDHSRPLTVRCLECHNTWINHVVGTPNVYEREGMILGVTCESCHGPAHEHVAYYRDHPNERATAETNKTNNVSAPILHPGKLDRESLIAVCSQCHSNAMKRRGPAFAHRPDQPLDESFGQLITSHHEDDHVANQTKFMRESVCFQRDESMTCITCHEPHTQSNTKKIGSQACYQCHTQSACPDQPNLPVALQDRCVECHMPPFIKINVNFQTESDNFVTPIRRWQHRIAVYPEARKELLRDWYREQSDEESGTRAAALTDELVQFYLGQLKECTQEYRYVGAIAAGREALRIDDRTEVREALQSAIGMQTELESQRATANQLLSQQRFPQVIPVLQGILDKKPDDAIAHGRLGTAFASMGQMGQAEEHWRRVIECDPNDAYGIGMLAWTAMGKGDWDAAISLYERANAIEPYEAKIQYHLGIAHASRKELNEALTCFRKALEIEPYHQGALPAMISTLRQLGRAAEAIVYAQTTVGLTGGRDIDTLMVLAETSAEAGDRQAAVASATSALRIAMQVDPALAARIQARLKDYDSSAP